MAKFVFQIYINLNKLMIQVAKESFAQSIKTDVKLFLRIVIITLGFLLPLKLLLF